MAALYQDFRPARFSELKGQDGISHVLKSQVMKGTPANAYLFSGPRGTGKTSSARILAMALNCLNPQEGEPCLECEHCVSMLKDALIDVIEIDAASNTGVDHARELRENVNLLPLAAKYKVYIIDEVHMLTTSAFNALLKTIEEPPKYAVFILATTELRKVLPTIISRCQRFDFKPITAGCIAEQLVSICAIRGFSHEQKAIDMIADAAGGGLRDALTILDQCMAMCDNIDIKTVEEVLGLAPDADILNLAGFVLKCNQKDALDLCHEILETGVTPQAIASQLALEFEQMLRTSGDVPRLVAALKTMVEAESDMRFSLRPALVLEWSLIKLMMPEHTGGSIEERLSKLEQQIASGNFAPGNVAQPDSGKKSANKKPAPSASVSIVSENSDKSADKPAVDASLSTLFAEITKKAPPLVKPFLRRCAPKEIKEGVLIAESETDVYALEAKGVAATLNAIATDISQGSVTRIKFRKIATQILHDIEEID